MNGASTWQTGVFGGDGGSRVAARLESGIWMGDLVVVIWKMDSKYKDNVQYFLNYGRKWSMGVISSIINDMKLEKLPFETMNRFLPNSKPFT